MNPQAILQRLERETGVAGLAEVLAERLDPSDLHSLLLEVFRRRAAARTPADVLAEQAANRFARPAGLDPRVALEWDRLAFASLPAGFTPMELSPVCPLGTNSAVATVSQNKTLTTTRGLEVVADGTNVLALECALRRRESLRAAPGAPDVVRLAASHRVLRTQAYADPRFLPHFRLFHLCTAGRDRGSGRFESEALVEQVGFGLHAVGAFLGPRVRLRVALTDLAAETPRERWTETLVSPLRAAFPAAEIDFDQARSSGRGYYRDLCFKLYAAPVGGEPAEIGDGGFVDWTAQLLSDAKERLCISGFGSERICGLRKDEFEAPDHG